MREFADTSHEKRFMFASNGNLDVRSFLRRDGMFAVVVLGDGNEARIDLRSLTLKDLCLDRLPDAHFLALARESRNVRAGMPETTSIQHGRTRR